MNRTTSNRFEQKLRYFVAEDAVAFAQRDPLVYEALIRKSRQPQRTALSLRGLGGSSGLDRSYAGHSSVEYGTASYASNLPDDTASNLENEFVDESGQDFRRSKASQKAEDSTPFTSRILLVTIVTAFLTLRTYTMIQGLSMIWCSLKHLHKKYE